MPKIGLWTAISLEWANQRDYLDKLFRVYPMQDNLRRIVPEPTLQQLKYYYDSRDSSALLGSADTTVWHCATRFCGRAHQKNDRLESRACQGFSNNFVSGEPRPIVKARHLSH